MNVIFLDFDGVLDTIHYSSYEDIERRIKILGIICKEFNSKVVIEASAKDAIDEETMETKSKWINDIFDLFKKYGIECIGRTPNVTKRFNEYRYLPMWKEDEIRLYLFNHPEIEHYCVIDDDDLEGYNSDLNKVRNHLVKTIYCSNNKDEEGLLLSHKEEVRKALEKENELRSIAIKRRNKTKLTK